ncbi:MAG: hypothetical protein PHQ98_00275 [Candidatus ainarchaeum sp.]|nr:hypothetical protein [Candidatus ainarchaeum sp.]
MAKEKKLNYKQKIALERIYRLFEIANESKDEKYQVKYVKLAKEIGKKVNVSVPKELKKKFCKNCFSLDVKGTKEENFLIVRCNKCNFVKKFRFDEQK